jgi:hypothetical protein
MTEYVYRVPYNLMCNYSSIIVTYVHIPTHKNVDPNYVRIFY